jgi:hypothetical protein
VDLAVGVRPIDEPYGDGNSADNRNEGKTDHKGQKGDCEKNGRPSSADLPMVYDPSSRLNEKYLNPLR